MALHGRAALITAGRCLRAPQLFAVEDHGIKPLRVFAFAEQAWSAPFFIFAAAGLVSIGAMGARASLRLPEPKSAAEFNTAAE